MSINSIGVLGAGLMGSGIAQIAAVSNHQVTLVEINEEALHKGLKSIETSLAKFIERGSMTDQQRIEALKNLHGSTELKALSNCDIVIEAIIENLDIKRETYAKLDALCQPETIFASNTSSLSITEMMTATSHEKGS